MRHHVIDKLLDRLMHSSRKRSCAIGRPLMIIVISTTLLAGTASAGPRDATLVASPQQVVENAVKMEAPFKHGALQKLFTNDAIADFINAEMRSKPDEKFEPSFSNSFGSMKLIQTQTVQQGYNLAIIDAVVKIYNEEDPRNNNISFEIITFKLLFEGGAWKIDDTDSHVYRTKSLRSYLRAVANSGTP